MHTRTCHTRIFANFFACLMVWAALGFVTLGAAQAGGITVIHSFAGPDGADPHAGLTLDSSGNLFGTTYAGGSAGKGTVFEIVHGTNAVTTLASFTGAKGNANGAIPYDGVTVDSSGNLFGTTEQGGAYGYGNGSAGYGTVWEIAHGTTTLTTIASFNGTNGLAPIGGVTVDSRGNLFGTTLEGGTAGAGNVWEIAAGTSAIVSLASFTEVNPIGGLPWGNVTLDAAGDIFGTTEVGGVGGAGTIWEIAAGTTTITTLASFTGTGTNGANPLCQLSLDSSDNLFGTTNSGGTGSEGTVFELAHGSGVITTLAQFNGTNGGGPGNIVTLDSSGNLFGTAYAGGANNAGTVWEIPHGATLTTLATFPGGAGGAGPRGAVTFDRFGDIFGTSGGSDNYGYGDGAVWEISPSQTHLLWDKTDGTASLWAVNPDGAYASAVYGPFSGWTARAVADAPDGTNWLLWTNTNGTASLWHVTALTAGGYTVTQYGPYPGYTAVSLSVDSGGNPHLLWDKTDGTANLWTVSPTNGTFTYTSYGPYAGWTANAVASGATVTDLLWTNVNGTASGYRIAANGSLTYHSFGPYSGYTAKSLSVGPDDGAHLLWDKTDGTALLWSVDFGSGAFTYNSYGPFSGYAAKAIATGPDGVTHILWDAANGTASLWAVTNTGYTYTAYGPFSGWTAVGVSAGP